MRRRWRRNIHKRYNKIQGTTRLKQTRWNYRTYVSREEQKQKLPCRCFLPTSPWRQRKTNMDSKARYDSFSNNNNLEQNHHNCLRYQYWLQQTINCTWNIQRSTWHVQLKTTRKKANSSKCQNHSHIVSNLETEKVLITDVLPCPTVSDHDAPYAIIKIPTASFQTRYKYIRNMKNFNTKEYYTDFSTLPFSTVYSFDNLDDQLAMLKK